MPSAAAAPGPTVATAATATAASTPTTTASTGSAMAVLKTQPSDDMSPLPSPVEQFALPPPPMQQQQQQQQEQQKPLLRPGLLRQGSITTHLPSPGAFGTLLDVPRLPLDASPSPHLPAGGGAESVGVGVGVGAGYPSPAGAVAGAGAPAALQLAAPESLYSAPSADCRYRCLDPVLPYLRDIIPASVACDLLDVYLTEPGSSLFRCASPYILTRIFRRASLLHPARPRPTTAALLATMLWCAAQTADIVLLHVPGSRARITNALYALATALVAQRDPDRWRRIHGLCFPAPFLPRETVWCGPPLPVAVVRLAPPPPPVERTAALSLPVSRLCLSLPSSGRRTRPD